MELGERLFLLFLAGGVEFCASLGQVEEIIPWAPPPEAGETPPEEGERVFRRGVEAPVTDLAEQLGLSGKETAAEPKIVMVRDAEGRAVGVKVEAVVGIDDFGRTPLIPFPTIMSRPGTEVFSGFYAPAGRPVLLLDLTRLAGEALR